MDRKEIEKMFLELNSVLVKFWKEQGRPDKEIKIELLERMLRWYKEMGYVTLNKQEPDVDLEEAAMNYIAPIENEDGLKVINFSGRDIKDAFIAGAKWGAEHLKK